MLDLLFVLFGVGSGIIGIAYGAYSLGKNSR